MAEGLQIPVHPRRNRRRRIRTRRQARVEQPHLAITDTPVPKDWLVGDVPEHIQRILRFPRPSLSKGRDLQSGPNSISEQRGVGPPLEIKAAVFASSVGVAQRVKDGGVDGRTVCARAHDGVVCRCGDELGRLPGERGVVVAQQVDEGKLVAYALQCVGRESAVRFAWTRNAYAKVGKVNVQRCEADVMIEACLNKDWISVSREIRYKSAIGMFQDAPLLGNDLSSDLEWDLDYQHGCVESSRWKVGVLLGDGIGLAFDRARCRSSCDGMRGDGAGEYEQEQRAKDDKD